MVETKSAEETTTAVGQEVPMREMVATVSAGCSLNDMHKAVDQLMRRGNEARNWLFHWDDIGLRRLVVVRSVDLDPTASEPVPALEAGQRVRFMVRVRAVKRRHTDQQESLIPKDQVFDWLSQRMAGFKVRSVYPEHFTVPFGKGGVELIPGYLVTGEADVTDIPAAMTTMMKGVGRLRGFGFGMVITSA